MIEFSTIPKGEQYVVSCDNCEYKEIRESSVVVEHSKCLVEATELVKFEHNCEDGNYIYAGSPNAYKRL